ncbi:MAG: hypothetical protein G01um101413_893 [Parcubacteria group bacterium Gr01-1014_13]|nr:MAG: hypothetical protein G01um101413_893 [Parcubacteria group bacterium Gr01-1014_13]
MDQELLKSLENFRPLKIYKIGSVIFRIYKAKNLYQPSWNNAVLKKITKLARQSYLRYGRVPLIDEYDKNAAIFLCRSSFGKLEEWLCLRFVPGNTDTHLLEDLNQYVYNGKTIVNIIKNKLVFRDNDLQTKLVAISRLCGIAPKNSAMKHTAQAFALINKEFFSETHFSYFLGVFRPEVLKKILRFSSRFSLSFPDAYKTLKCRPEQVYLDRSWSAYHFPGYFLNASQLLKSLQKLIEEKKLNIVFIKKYAKNYNPEIKKTANYMEILNMIYGINAVLLWKGKIPGSKITGEELRALLDRSVADGSKLKIISAANWKKQLKRIKIKQVV